MRDIHRAAGAGDLETVRREVESSGVPPDLRDEDGGLTPLMHAVSSEEVDADKIDSVIAWLLAHGADPNARTEPPDTPLVSPLAELGEDVLDDLDPEVRALVESSLSAVGDLPDLDRNSVLTLAVQQGDVRRVERLLQAGADPAFTTPHGYDALIYAVYQEDATLVERLLREERTPRDGETSYGETALGVASRNGDFELVRLLLAHGADPARLGWNALMHAVALGTLQEVEDALRSRNGDSADLEARDPRDRTALLLALAAGSREKAERLWRAECDGAARGRCSRPALSHAIRPGTDPDFLRWLLSQPGIDIDAADEFGQTPLMEAVERNLYEAVRVLLEAGADVDARDHVKETAIDKASDPRIIEALLAAGRDLDELRGEARRTFIGLETGGDPGVSREVYQEGRYFRFGKSNPERMQIPFWEAMVRTGVSAYTAAARFDDADPYRGEPVWCHERFGASLTRLPDGRFVEIGGEHEDHYDPDFRIYNDVIVHDGTGNFVIYGYPEAVFPPTDFHSATWWNGGIYILGGLGYHGQRAAGRTPVYRLCCKQWSIGPVATTGDPPGWIHDHQAQLHDDDDDEAGDPRLRVTGGQVHQKDGSLLANTAAFELDLETGAWRRVAAAEN